MGGRLINLPKNLGLGRHEHEGGDNRVPLVNVCRAFDLGTITPFQLLRRLDVKLDWQPAHDLNPGIFGNRRDGKVNSVRNRLEFGFGSVGSPSRRFGDLVR